MVIVVTIAVTNMITKVVYYYSPSQTIWGIQRYSQLLVKFKGCDQPAASSKLTTMHPNIFRIGGN